jgi:hypothetical protein
LTQTIYTGLVFSAPNKLACASFTLNAGANAFAHTPNARKPSMTITDFYSLTSCRTTRSLIGASVGWDLLVAAFLRPSASSQNESVIRLSPGSPWRGVPSLRLPRYGLMPPKISQNFPENDAKSHENRVKGADRVSGFVLADAGIANDLQPRAIPGETLPTALPAR